MKESQSSSLTAKEARELAQDATGQPISRSAWYRLIAEGAIESTRIRGRIYLTAQQILTWAQAAKEGRRW